MFSPSPHPHRPLALTPFGVRKKPLRKKRSCLEMVTSEELNATFAKVGNDFHFDEVSAEYAPFRDLKVR